jgi:hypothetical protein
VGGARRLDRHRGRPRPRDVAELADVRGVTYRPYSLVGPGQALAELQFAAPRGERSAGRRWGLRDPRWAACEAHPMGRLAKRPVPPMRSGGTRLPALHLRRSATGRAALSRTWTSHACQPAPGAGSYCPGAEPRHRPGASECVAPKPAAPHLPTAGFPGGADPVSSEPYLRPCPHRCSVFTASHDDAPRRTGQDDNPHSGVCVNSPNSVVDATTDKD